MKRFLLALGLLLASIPAKADLVSQHGFHGPATSGWTAAFYGVNLKYALVFSVKIPGTIVGARFMQYAVTTTRAQVWESTNNGATWTKHIQVDAPTPYTGNFEWQSVTFGEQAVFASPGRLYAITGVMQYPGWKTVSALDTTYLNAVLANNGLYYTTAPLDDVTPSQMTNTTPVVYGLDVLFVPGYTGEYQ